VIKEVPPGALGHVERVSHRAPLTVGGTQVKRTGPPSGSSDALRQFIDLATAAKEGGLDGAVTIGPSDLDRGRRTGLSCQWRRSRAVR
jgi:hypothetical protein